MERQPARQGLEEHDSEGIEVTGARRGGSGELLRRHVGRRSHEARLRDRVPDPCELRFDGEAEVEHHDSTVGGHEHVRWFEVPVQLSRRVDRKNTGRELAERSSKALLIESAVRTHPPVERLALDELHREEPELVGAKELVKSNEVLVVDLGDRAKFVLDLVHCRGVCPHEGALARILGVNGAPVGEVRERLERDAPLVMLVERLEHDAHAARPQLANDREAIARVEACEHLRPHGARGSRRLIARSDQRGGS